jgi:hypothetical protein
MPPWSMPSHAGAQQFLFSAIPYHYRVPQFNALDCVGDDSVKHHFGDPDVLTRFAFQMAVMALEAGRGDFWSASHSDLETLTLPGREFNSACRTRRPGWQNWSDCIGRIFVGVLHARIRAFCAIREHKAGHGAADLS